MGCGAITTPPNTDFSWRLGVIYNDMTQLLQVAQPEAVAIEELFFGHNVTTGINVAQRLEDFTPEVAEMAASLEMILEKPVSRPALAAALLEELDRSYEALKQGDLEEYRTCYRRDCVNLGRPVRLMGPGGQEEARAVDIDRDFGLVVRTPDGAEKTIRSGEVSVRGLYGYAE